MKIALAQINATLGDFAANADKIIDYVKKAKDRGCELVIFPEAALFGYHPVDLLERPSSVQEQLKALNRIHRSMPPNVVALVGAITLSPFKHGKLFCNSAVLLQKNKKMKIFAKQLLPTYDVFDEGRHIEPGDVSKNYFRFKNKNILVTVCEDIWAWENSHHGKRSPYKTNPLKKLKASQTDLVVNLSASPFTYDKWQGRKQVCSMTAKHFKTPVVYVNMVGGQDEIIFDGGSFVTAKNGKIVAQAHHFTEEILVYDSELGRGFYHPQEKEKLEKIRKAIVLGIQDFVSKVGFERVHIGLSGGIDSALVACLLVDALGPHKVTAVTLPGPFTSEESNQLSQALIENLGIHSYQLNISPLYKLVEKTVNEIYDINEFSLVHENLQARLRGMSLMAFSNQNSSLLINTSNKSEMAMGYSTLYGDLIGGICPIGDLTKTQVFELSRWYNKEHEVIPSGIIERPPSAELRPNQKDSDSLPEYVLLDKAIEKIVEKYKSPSSALEKKVLLTLMKTEFKRWQAPPILKVSNHAFGRGRRLPIAHKCQA